MNEGLSVSKLRRDQSLGIEKARLGFISGAITQLICAPPGAGKTHTALHLIKSTVAKSNRAFFIVDDLRLLEQVVGKLLKDGVPVGVIQGNHPLTDIRQPVQVCMIQSLATRWDIIFADPVLRPSVIVADEAHVLYGTHKRIIADCRQVGCIAYLGLSATPFTKGLGRYFDRMISLSTAQELIDQGNLVPTLVKAPFIPDLSNVPTVGGRPDSNWVECELAKIMGDKHVVDDAAQHWLEFGEDRKTLGYAVNIHEARAFAMEFSRLGVEVEYIDSYCEPRIASQKLQAFERGDLQMVWSVGMFIKGYDDPALSCIIDCAPTKSLMRHFQKMGRGARSAPWLGKKNLFYFDHAGNVILNGLPTDPMPGKLDDGRKKGLNPDRKILSSQEVKLLHCPHCSGVTRGLFCGICGNSKLSQETPQHANGELSWIGSDPFQKHAQQKESLFQEDLDNVLAGLLGYAEKTKRDFDWVKKAYKKRTNLTLQNGSRCVVPENPSPSLLLWIKTYNVKQSKCHA